MTPHTRVVLEISKTWAFASALDWPGWCRRGKGEHGALAALADYADRYAVVAGASFRPGDLQVVDRVPGTPTTDFGAPDAKSALEDEPLDHAEAQRFAALLTRCWSRFDEVVAAAPEQLSKGPRGGGRDRDAVGAHVREAERSYARRVGARLPPRTPWPEQRAALLRALDAGPQAWSVRYAYRRIAWHILDHGWEIEDKSG